MKPALSCLALGLVLALLPARAWSADSELFEGDQHFLEMAAQSETTEIRLGEIAAEKAIDPKVKTFGQLMVTGHGEVNQKLNALAARKGASTPNRLDEKNTRLVSELSAAGKDFDQRYVTVMVALLKRDVAEFQDFTKSAQDPEARAFAKETLPILEQHLQMIEEIQKSQ